MDRCYRVGEDTIFFKFKTGGFLLREMLHLVWKDSCRKSCYLVKHFLVGVFCHEKNLRGFWTTLNSVFRAGTIESHPPILTSISVSYGWCRKRMHLISPWKIASITWHSHWHHSDAWVFWRRGLTLHWRLFLRCKWYRSVARSSMVSSNRGSRKSTSFTWKMWIVLMYPGFSLPIVVGVKECWILCASP